MTKIETRTTAQNEIELSSTAESFERPGTCRDSDTALAPVLDRLEGQGAIVFHDVPGEGFDLDHVVIHPTGVYVLDTVTTSAPGRSAVNFDGSALRLNGGEPGDSLITRARAASAWLQELLESATGRPVLVRPTLVFPGGFVESEQALDADMLVVNPGALPGFVANARPVLSRQDVMLVAYHLSRFIGARAIG